MDYAGPLFGRMYLIVVDAFSKWVEIAVTHTATSEAIRDFKIVHDGRLGRLDECHVTQNPRDI